LKKPLNIPVRHMTGNGCLRRFASIFHAFLNAKTSPNANYLLQAVRAFSCAITLLFLLSRYNLNKKTKGARLFHISPNFDVFARWGPSWQTSPFERLAFVSMGLTIVMSVRPNLQCSDRFWQGVNRLIPLESSVLLGVTRPKIGLKLNSIFAFRFI